MYVRKMLNKKEKQSRKNKLSVIIPIYNAQEEIRNLLEDIKSQSFHDFEVLMINDGSQDKSGQICQEFEKIDKRFIYIYQENGGVSSARNHGLSIAQGQFISFLDADDRIPQDRFETMLQIMDENDEIDLVIGQYTVDIKNGKFPFSLWQSDLIGKHNLETLIKDYSKSMSGFYYGVIWNKLYKRDIIVENNIAFDESMSWGEDLLFNLWYFCNIYSIFYLKTSVYHYCYTEKSLLSNTAIYKDYIDFIRYKKVLELGEKLHNKQDYNTYLKKANKFFLERIIRQMSMKVMGAKFHDMHKYEAFKKYILLPEVIDFWRNSVIFKDNFIYYLMQKLVIKKRYHILYYLFIVKDRINKNPIWNWLKQIIFKS